MPAEPIKKTTPAKKAVPVALPAKPEPVPDSMVAALIALQAKLPRIRKADTAEVETKTGRVYKYRFADLADVSEQALPLLSSLGLCWMCKPTLVDGHFVLLYRLSHISGDVEEGTYPLPPPETAPQSIGSAITYARRYCLCAVTGIAPDKDDDDAAAAASRSAPRELSTDAAWLARMNRMIGEAGTIEALREARTALQSGMNEGLGTEEDGWILFDRIKAKVADIHDQGSQDPAVPAPGVAPGASNHASGVSQVPPGANEGSRPSGGPDELEAAQAAVEGAFPGAHTVPDPADAVAAARDEVRQDLNDMDQPAPATPAPPPTGDPQRIEALEKMVRRAGSTDSLGAMYRSTWGDASLFTTAEKDRIRSMFDVAYEQLTGEKRPAKFEDWNMGVKAKR